MMKIKQSLLLISFVLFTYACFGENKTESDWFPFVISEKLDPDSPANIGKLVLDPPAGKHGFVKIKDSHFYFEDGTRAKFWGTNLCFNACFPSKENAEIIADRLAFFGFNAVRLHHMDFHFEPDGIFEDVKPASPDPQSKTTAKLSNVQLDRLDYFIYQLKKRGIYIDMNLLVTRTFTKVDGVIDADKLGRAAKPVSVFNAKLIELQKKYAQDLLTHYNPYTKLRYCDDSAIALVEITNENSIVDSWYSDRLNGDFGGLKTGAIPDYYSHELDTKWNKWLKEKYGAEINIPRPVFKFAAIYSKKSVEDVKAFYADLQRTYFNEMLGFLKQQVGVKVPIAGMGGHYNKNDLDSMSSCDFIDTHTYWDHPWFSIPWSWDKYDFRIRNKSVFLDKKLGIIGDIIDVFPSALRKPYTITEWNHCYPNQYAYETPLLVASEALNNNWDGLFQFAFSHGWDINPIFDDIQSYFDVIANTQQLILNSLGSMIFLKDGDIKTLIDNGVFTIKSYSLEGAIGFIKDRPTSLGPFIVTPGQDGAIILFKKANDYVLFTLSEVRNTGSKWNAGGRFDWGKSPVLLKNIGVKITSQKKFKIYELDNHGTRMKETDTFRSRSPWFELLFEH